jgi:hypothetical protein
MKEKILEILQSKLHGMAGHNWLIGIDETDCDRAAIEIAAYVEQHYYPKEFVEWLPSHADYNILKHEWISSEIGTNIIGINDLYQYWLTQIKK